MKQIILIIAALLICGCNLFKKTSKTSEMATQLVHKELETTRLVLKRADKETQVFTYWNDSGFYQYQHIKEQIDQAKSGKISIEEKQVVKQSNRIKKNEPLNIWVYISVLILLLGGYWVFKIAKYFTP